MAGKIVSTLLSLLLTTTLCAEPLWQGEGRILLSSDGNEHDWDDWAASAMTLALLASQGLQDNLTLYTYSDHIWGSNQRFANVNGMSAYEHMRESVLRGADHFGFDRKKMLCAVDNAEVAYNAVRNQINNSSATSPLFIIAAGPMQVVGEGMKRAERSKLKYVTLISHSEWNDNHSDNPPPRFKSWDIHSGWTLNEMIEEFDDEAKFVHITNQNFSDGSYTPLQCRREEFDWLLSSEPRKESWEWLYRRLESCATKDNTIFDVSDSGMVVYLLTGEEHVTPAMIHELMK